MDEQHYNPAIAFVLGIMPRSGTHYLVNLLCQHPKCKKSVLPEDGLLASSGYLNKYVNFNNKEWTLTGGMPAIDVNKILFESLGDGLLTFLKKIRLEEIKKKSEPSFFIDELQKQPKYLITKTPNVFHLVDFFKFFPNQKLIIIVRDGRAIVESNQTSFGGFKENIIRDWVNAIDKLNTFLLTESRVKKQCLVVKYEDLHSKTELEMRKILCFLQLDEEEYDYNKAIDLPVVGSSVFKRGHGRVHWLPVKKTADFNPLTRTEKWSRKDHERFNWLAKDRLGYFGYEPTLFKDAQLKWKLYNIYLDQLMHNKRWLNKFYRFGRSAIKK